jgi:hypothetical protein
MTVHPQPARVLCAFLLALTAVTPLSAAVKKHAVAHPKVEKITITGTVTDAVTGAPLKGVTVGAGDVTAVVTDDTGKYTLTVFKGGTITATRVGYVTVQKQAAGSPLDFALPQTATITIKTTKGETFLVDAPTLKFGYPQIFQGYASGESPNLCRVNGEGKGETWLPTKAEMKRVVGPARALTSAACCDRGPVMAIDVELKSGEKVTGYLNDNCFGYNIEVIGFERSSAAAKYIPLTEVTEIVFP